MDVSTRSLFPEMRRCSAADVERALQMYRDHRVEIRLLHLVKEYVAQDAGIVHHSVDATEIINRRPHHGLRAGPVSDTVSVDNSFSAKLLDFIDNLLCRRHIGTVVTPDRTAQIVDDHR